MSEQERERAGAEATMRDASKVVVEIDLASLWVGGEHGSTFAEFVADRAAVMLLKEGSAVPELRRRIAAIADEQIREQLRPIVAEALERSVQKTDGFGTPRGEPKSLRDVVIEAATKELTQKRQTSGRSAQTSLVEDVVRVEVQDSLGRELRDAVHAAKGDVLAAVREKAGEVVAETIEKLAAGRPV